MGDSSFIYARPTIQTKLNNDCSNSYIFATYFSVPGILNEAVPATTQNVDAEIQKTVRDAYKYTAIIEKVCYNERDDPPNGLSILLLKQSLVNSRQHEAFLRILLVCNILLLLRLAFVSYNIAVSENKNHSLPAFFSSMMSLAVHNKLKCWNHNWQVEWISYKLPYNQRQPYLQHKSM